MSAAYITANKLISDCIPFYRAMHFSAKRGIAIAYVVRLSVCLSVRPSVRLSVTLVDCDHIGWNSSKLILPLISLRCSLFATPTWRVCSKGNTPKFGPKLRPPVDLSVGDIRSQIAAEWLQIAQWSQWRAYRRLPSLFLMVPSMTPYDLSLPPKTRVPYFPNIREWPYLCNGCSDPLHVWF